MDKTLSCVPGNVIESAVGRLVVALGLTLFAPHASIRAQPVTPSVFYVEDFSGEVVAEHTPDTLKRDFRIRELTTTTPWSSEIPITYRGPYLRDILGRYNIVDFESIYLTAYNEFRAKVYINEIQEYDPVLAIERACEAKDYTEGRCDNGQKFRPLTLDEFGPFYLIWDVAKLPKNYIPSRNSIWVWFAVRLRPSQ